MKKFSGTIYPNNISKLTLFESFLSCRDFNCQPEDFKLDLAMIRIEEANNDSSKNICYWYEDRHGNLIVDQIVLADESKRIKITKETFKMIDIDQNVFISYAKEDQKHASKLYKQLKEHDVNAWLDEENLLPGQRWEIEIEEQIFKSNYFIALLSTNSVSKRGYVQREIRLALEVLERMPEKEIFIIPARLDECAPSHKVLNNIHRVDLFPDWEKGVYKIFKTLSIKL